jgi:peptidoglycan/xylan/chitin deacetylase (PgdA/CDA1 family)
VPRDLAAESSSSYTRQRIDALKQLLPELKAGSQNQTMATVDEICRQLEVDSQPDLMLSWDEIRAIIQNPLISIGSHCDTHRILTSIVAVDVSGELSRSKTSLEQKLGVEIAHVAYPNGDCNAAVASAAKAAGYRAGYVTHGRSDDADPINRTDSDRFRLTRIALGPVPTTVLASEMAGFYVAMRRGRHHSRS